MRAPDKPFVNCLKCGSLQPRMNVSCNNCGKRLQKGPGFFSYAIITVPLFVVVWVIAPLVLCGLMGELDIEKPEYLVGWLVFMIALGFATAARLHTYDETGRDPGRPIEPPLHD